MPDIAADLSQPWRDAATITAALSQPWRDGVLLISAGGPFYMPEAPPGSTTTDPPTLAAEFTLPAADAFRVVHTVSVVDLTDGAALDLEAFTIGDDDGSAVQTFTASGPDSLFARVAGPGDPPAWKITVDGIAWVFAIESPRRTRDGGARRSVSVTGRSLTIAAGEPYAAAENWTNLGPASAAQLVDQALAFTGVESRWRLTDWPVPDRVWSYTGTPLAVAQRVAEAGGGVVYSDRTAPVLTIAPRYPYLPHELSRVAPDVEIHVDAVAADSYTRADRPPWNAVYVAGQTQGVQGLVRLEGTLADRLAPPVTDALLTDIDAVRQRGVAVLGAGGPRADVSYTLPILTGPGRPGVLSRGMLVRVIGEGAPWHGFVRSVSVNYARPVIRQTIGIERHTGDIPGTVITEAA